MISILQVILHAIQIEELHKSIIQCKTALLEVDK